MKEYLAPTPSALQDCKKYDLYALRQDDQPGIYVKTIECHPDNVQNILGTIIRERFTAGWYIIACKVHNRQ